MGSVLSHLRPVADAIYWLARALECEGVYDIYHVSAWCPHKDIIHSLQCLVAVSSTAQ